MSLEKLVGPERSRTAHEYVRDTLRAAVLDGTLRVGVRLVQSELAERLGVSTTPVREALRNLASEGLVVFDPHRGALVRSLDMAEVRELYELRMTLEPIMIRRVIDAVTPEQLAAAAELQRRMDQPCSSSTWAEVNREFHALFSAADGSSRLAGLLDGLRDSSAPYVARSLIARPEQIKEANAEHAALLGMYQQRDSDAVIALTLAHYEATLAAVQEADAQGGL